jgi:hypothetical protein
MYQQDDVVSKPFRIPEIVPKIEELAAQHASSSTSSSSVSTLGGRRTTGRPQLSSENTRNTNQESTGVSPGPTTLLK